MGWSRAGAIRETANVFTMIAIGAVAFLRLARLLPSVSSQLYDFATFVDSGRAALVGQNPYVYDASLVEQIQRPAPNMNPPISVPIFSMIAPLDPHAALQIWSVVSLAGFFVLGLVLMRAWHRYHRPLIVVWLVSLQPLWATLELGQIYVPLALAIAIAIVLLPRRPIPSGILIGLVTAIKPNLVIWPLLLGCAGYLAPAIAALLSFAVVSALPLVLYGPEIYVQWLGAAAAAGDMRNPINGSIFGVTHALGAPGVGPVLAIGLLGLVAIVSRRFRPTPRSTSALGIVSGTFAAPVAWPGYFLFALPVFFSSDFFGPLPIVAAALSLPIDVAAYVLPANVLSPAVSAFYPILYLTIIGTLVVKCRNERRLATEPQVTGDRQRCEETNLHRQQRQAKDVANLKHRVLSEEDLVDADRRQQNTDPASRDDPRYDRPPVLHAKEQVITRQDPADQGDRANDRLKTDLKT